MNTTQINWDTVTSKIAKGRAEKERQLRLGARENAEKASKRARLALVVFIFALVLAAIAGWYHFDAQDKGEKLSQEQLNVIEARDSIQDAFDRYLKADQQRRQLEDAEKLREAESYRRIGEYYLATRAWREAFGIDSTRIDLRDSIRRYNNQ